MQILQNKKLIIVLVVLVLGAGAFAVYKFVLKKPAPVVVKKEVVKKEASKPSTPKDVDYTKYKTIEVLKADISASKKGAAPMSVKEFFNNDKKELFVHYYVNGANAVAKLDPQSLKWIMLQEWNGSPDCSIFDKAGVPTDKSKKDFMCIVNK